MRSFQMFGICIIAIAAALWGGSQAAKLPNKAGEQFSVSQEVPHPIGMHYCTICTPERKMLIHPTCCPPKMAVFQRSLEKALQGPTYPTITASR